MSLEGSDWYSVKCDTPLIDRGRNVFAGWARFHAIVDYPGGHMTLRCLAIGDYYEIRIDGAPFAEAGPGEGIRNAARDVPRDFAVSLPAGRHEFVFRVRDRRAGGGMVGPVYLATDLDERIF